SPPTLSALFSARSGNANRYPGDDPLRARPDHPRLMQTERVVKNSLRLCTGPPGSAHSSHFSGSVKVNVEPWPTWLLTQILPPCSSTNFRESVSPRPVPSCFLA